MNPEALKPHICLMMIVRNEGQTLPRLLPSVSALISSWVIIDTGSTDDTKSVIAELLAGIPGELLEREWKSFGANRSDLVSLIPREADFAFLLDADHEVSYDSLESFYAEIQSDTQSNCFMIPVRDSNLEYLMPYLVRQGPSYSYVGSTHEYLDAKTGLQKSKPIESLVITHVGNGGSKSDKFERDRQLLEEDILRGEATARNHFYLAQTYEHLNLADLALKHYSIAESSSTWDEEKYMSNLRSGRLHKHAGRIDLALDSFGMAYECCPDRVEALYEMVKIYESKGMFSLAYTILKSQPFPTRQRVLFVELWIKGWGLEVEAGVVAWRVGLKDEAREIFERLLEKVDLPESAITLVKKNLEYC
jgi:glycosyltransferase involved in cell wall biosynthesis